jgi:hypothetical protein
MPDWETVNRILSLEQKMEKAMAAIDDLKASVAKEDTVIASAVTLLNGLSAQIKAAGTDPAALAAVTADIDAQTNALAAAVSQNTPAQVEMQAQTGNAPPVPGTPVAETAAPAPADTVSGGAA